MDYLQYGGIKMSVDLKVGVLNLVINGLPSICIQNTKLQVDKRKGFKPCYKWITFNIKTAL